jgi:hypothetical protein
MSILSELVRSSSNIATLDRYLEQNFHRIYDYMHHVNHAALSARRREFKSLLLFLNVFRQLDYDIATNVSFLNLLLNGSIRLGESAFFTHIYNFMVEESIEVNTIARAASLYLIGVRDVDTLVENYDKIVQLLEQAYINEDDSIIPAATTLICYYALVIDRFAQFAPSKVARIRDRISDAIRNRSFEFIHDPVLRTIQEIDITFASNPHGQIQSILDNYLNPTPAPALQVISTQQVEAGTEYTTHFVNVEKSFSTIHGICSKLYQAIQDDSVYGSLRHGVAILKTEAQLYAYIYSFGRMHNAKLDSAFPYLPPIFFNTPSNIIDWACGQGIGTISFKDFLNQKGIDKRINQITLIEPSSIALKRALFHVKNGSSLHTINKKLNELRTSDFVQQNETKTLHVFSNIIDMESFSLSQLIDLVKATFSGENYFIVVSPFIDTTKTARIDAFLSQFSTCAGYELYGSHNNRAREWQGNWTRVIRVFKVNL